LSLFKSNYNLVLKKCYTKLYYLYVNSFTKNDRHYKLNTVDVAVSEKKEDGITAA